MVSSDTIVNAVTSESSVVVVVLVSSEESDVLVDVVALVAVADELLELLPEPEDPEELPPDELLPELPVDLEELLPDVLPVVEPEELLPVLSEPEELLFELTVEPDELLPDDVLLPESEELAVFSELLSAAVSGAVSTKLIVLPSSETVRPDNV